MVLARDPSSQVWVCCFGAAGCMLVAVVVMGVTQLAGTVPLLCGDSG